MNRTFVGFCAESWLRGSVALSLLIVWPLMAGCPAPAEAPTPSPSPTSVALTPEETADPVLPSASPTPTPAPGASPTVTVFRVASGTDDKRAHLTRETLSLKPGENAAVAALNHMAQEKDSPLPKGTRARSVEIAGGTATVNFNRAFADNFAGDIGGDEREALIFNAITATLGQFEGVKQVQILVDGKKVPLGGTQDTTEPLPLEGGGGTKVSLRP